MSSVLILASASARVRRGLAMMTRHTWGYREYGLKKHITLDEFMHGRKRRDGIRT